MIFVRNKFTKQGGLRRRQMLVSHWVDAHQSAEEVVACLRVEVATRRPGAVGRVDLLDEVLGEDVVVVAAMDEDQPHQEQT